MFVSFLSVFELCASCRVGSRPSVGKEVGKKELTAWFFACLILLCAPSDFFFPSSGIRNEFDSFAVFD